MKDVLQCYLALGRGYVCELHKTVDVADGIDAWDVGLHVFIYDDATRCGFYTNVRKVQAIEIGNTTYGHQHDVGLHAFYPTFLLKRDNQAPFLLPRGGGSDFFGNCSDMEVYAAFLQAGAQTLGQVAIEVRKYLLTKLYDGDFYAEATEDAGKLQSDDTSTNDCQARGQLFEVEYLGTRDHPFGMSTGDGQELSLAARCDDDMLAYILFVADCYGMWVKKACFAFHKRDAGSLHQLGHTSLQSLHYLFLAKKRRSEEVKK